MKKEIATNVTMDKNMVIRKAETLDIDELKLSKTTTRVLEKRDLIESLVWFGRELAIKNDCHQISLDKAPKWQKEVVSALDQAGFIRHDYMRTYRVWQLYDRIMSEIRNNDPEQSYEGFTIELGDFLSEEIYENTPAISDTIFASVMKKLAAFLPRRYEIVIVSRFGLEDGTTKTLDALGEELSVPSSRIRAMEKGVIEMMRWPDLLRWFPPLFGFVPPERPHRNVLYDGIITPDLDVSIDELYFDFRVYICLKRANINTVGDLASLSVDDFRRIRHLTYKDRDEITKKLRAFLS